MAAGLVKRLGDGEANVRFSAALALGQLGQAAPQTAAPEVVAGLVERLGDGDTVVRGSAALALDPSVRTPGKRIPDIPSGCVPILIGLLEDQRELEYPSAPVRQKTRDLAWVLLRQYSERTGERIYWPPPLCERKISTPFCATGG